MARTFTEMCSRVVQYELDTDSAMLTLVGYWLNDKYAEISNRTVWSALVKFDYTFPTVANQQGYTLPTDFNTEIFCADITNGARLNKYTEGPWFEERYGAYSVGTISSGTPSRYIISRNQGKILLDPAPDRILTIAFPYCQSVADLTGSGAPVIADIDDILELGAMAEMYAYKKQFQKADYYLKRYEYRLAQRIGQEKSVSNFAQQFIPAGYKIDGTSRLTGDSPYATP